MSLRGFGSTHLHLYLQLPYILQFFFFCLLPSEKNGIAVACKNADLFAQLDQKYVDKIIRKKIRYIRFCPDDASSDYLPWQTVLKAATKEVCKIMF